MTYFVAWLTCREVARRRLLWIGLGLGIVFLVFFGVAYQASYSEMTSTHPANMPGIAESAIFLTIAGLYAVNYLIVMLSVLISVDTISGEIASHSIQSLATKPLRRWEIYLGKWLGFALLICAGTLLLGGGVVCISWFLSGKIISNALAALGLLILQGLVLLSVTMLGGVRFSTLANGVLVFMLYALAFLGGWTEQIGALLGNQTAVHLGIFSSLLMPCDAVWRLAAYLMQPPIMTIFNSTPFTVLSVPNGAMVIYAVFYLLIMVALGVREFAKRDL